MQRLLPDASQDVCDLSRLTFENVRSAKCEGSSPAAVVELQFMKVVGKENTLVMAKDDGAFIVVVLR